MSRVQRTLIALGLAFALPVLSGAKQAPTTTAQVDATCTAVHETDDRDGRWQWRLRAFRHLDCVTATIDRALAQASGATGSHDRIVISRDDLERMRIHAWWARDAAARIGR